MTNRFHRAIRLKAVRPRRSRAKRVHCGFDGDLPDPSAPRRRTEGPRRIYLDEKLEGQRATVNKIPRRLRPLGVYAWRTSARMSSSRFRARWQ